MVVDSSVMAAADSGQQFGRHFGRHQDAEKMVAQLETFSQEANGERYST
jgi:hypothetical protein